MENYFSVTHYMENYSHIFDTPTPIPEPTATITSTATAEATPTLYPNGCPTEYTPPYGCYPLPDEVDDTNIRINSGMELAAEFASTSGGAACLGLFGVVGGIVLTFTGYLAFGPSKYRG